MFNLLSQALLVLCTISTVAVASWSKIQIEARGEIVGPSAAYQIYESDPDRTNMLGNDGSVSSDNPTSTGGIVSSTSTFITGTSSVVSSISSIFSSISSFAPSNTTAATTVAFSNTTASTSIANTSTVASPTATIAIVPHNDNETIPFNGTYSNQTFVGNSTRTHRLSARSANFPFVFTVSQGAGGVNQTELVVTFNNLHCPPASYGPYSFEFNFVPEAAYNSFGNNQINMFRLPAQLPAHPTYNNIQPIKGSLIGTFELPTGTASNEPKLIFINQLVCVNSINLLFEIAQTSSEAGSVIYINKDGMGLRERSGT